MPVLWAGCLLLLLNTNIWVPHWNWQQNLYRQDENLITIMETFSWADHQCGKPLLHIKGKFGLRTVYYMASFLHRRTLAELLYKICHLSANNKSVIHQSTHPLEVHYSTIPGLLGQSFGSRQNRLFFKELPRMLSFLPFHLPKKENHKQTPNSLVFLTHHHSGGIQTNSHNPSFFWIYL